MSPMLYQSMSIAEYHRNHFIISLTLGRVVVFGFTLSFWVDLLLVPGYLDSARHGLPLTAGPHVRPVIGCPLPLVLYHLYLNISCRQHRLCRQSMVLWFAWCSSPTTGSLAWLLVQAPYSPLLGVLIRVTLISPRKFPLY
jgi:hypothetical protein